MKRSAKTILTNEDVSVDVVLERRQRSYSCGEPRVRGQAARFTPSELAPTAIDERTRKVAASAQERVAIRQVVEAFERLPANRVKEMHGVLTTDPYTSISDGTAVVVDKKAVTAWVNGNLFKTLSKQFTDPLEFADMNIALVDEQTAAATYTITQGGVVGTSAVVLVKGQGDKWRISVHCQHPITG